MSNPPSLTSNFNSALITLQELTEGNIINLRKSKQDLANAIATKVLQKEPTLIRLETAPYHIPKIHCASYQITNCNGNWSLAPKLLQDAITLGIYSDKQPLILPDQPLQHSILTTTPEYPVFVKITDQYVLVLQYIRSHLPPIVLRIHSNWTDQL